MASSASSARPRSSGHWGQIARKRINAAKGAARTKNGARYQPLLALAEPGTTLLRIDDSQCQCLADCLSTVQHVEFAQRLLHVVLHGERADVEDHADLDVALAVV